MELLPFDAALDELVARRASAGELRAAARARGHTARVLDPLRCYMRIAPGAFEMHYRGRGLADYGAVIPRIGASVTFTARPCCASSR